MRLTSKLKQEMINEDFWNKPCIHSGDYGVEAEHALYYSGRQINERWAIVPVIREYNRNPSPDIKKASALAAMQQAKDWGLWDYVKEKYHKRDWDRDFELLSNR